MTDIVTELAAKPEVITPAKLLQQAYPKAWPVMRLRLTLSWDALPQPVRGLAHKRWFHDAADPATTAREYLQLAFQWCQTPEGHPHWHALHDSPAGLLTAAQLLVRRAARPECVP